MNFSKLHALLLTGLSQLTLHCDEQQQEQIIRYIELLYKWNQHFNLTAIRNPEEMLSTHILDSLSVLPFIKGLEILDIGSGPGLPGIPLAICLTDASITLLDSNGKKTRFCRQAVIELGLKRVNVVKSRLQEYRPEQGFDTVISRAFADLESLYTQAMHLRRPSGQMLAMKGRYPEVEIEALQRHTKLQAVHKLTVPGLDRVERHLICF